MQQKYYLIFGIIAVFVLVGIGFLYLSNPPQTPSQEGKIIVNVAGPGETGSFRPECFDKSQLTELADYIIEGTVKEVDIITQETPITTNITIPNKPIPENLTIKISFSYTTISIENYVKGTPLEEDEILVVTLATHYDFPVFKENDKVSIYLHETNGEFSVYCGKHGVEEL